jgi:predicted DNA-binding WGR domain protein
MSEQKTYLELSEGDSGSHKFYEVTVNGVEISIRYGRIGDRGQTKVSTFATPEKALAEATKKLNEKKRKGYEPAVMGERQKRAVTRRQITSSNSTAKQSPVLWKFATGASAFGVFADETGCWVGNQDGRIYTLTHEGQVTNQFKLPDGVKCIVSDRDWLYAGCDDGKVYDLGGKVPRVAYEIARDVDIFWIDISDGILGVSDRDGGITTINHEDESQWTKRSTGNAGWMVRCDEIGIYHGHTHGVTMYDWEDGQTIWHQPTNGAVLFGWQEESMLYVGTANHLVQSFTKKGEVSTGYRCDAAIYSCAAAEDGEYVFAGDNYSSIYCFNRGGDRLWKLGTGCGSAYSMQFFKGRLYIVTTDGSFACIDASESAILAAQAGTYAQAVNIKAPKLEDVLPSATLETTSDRSRGVLVECFQEGSSLRIRVISDGYNQNWKVQFPKDIREVGARYLVDEIRESTSGGFYRAFGDIRKLV